MESETRGRGERSEGGGEPDGPRLRDDFPTAAAALRALEAAGLHLAVAESCTGGLLGAALSAVPGASAVLSGGVIAYSDAAKRGLLGVPDAVLAAHGAVSREAAEAMAVGVRRALGVEVGVAVTGIAGPGNSGTGKPVGLVVVCAVGPADVPTIVELHDDRGREANRAQAVRAALRLCAEVAGDATSGRR